MLDITCPHLHTLLGDLLQRKTERISFAGAGMFSQAYAITAGGEEYILRLNRFEEDFRKDQHAAAEWSSPAVPIPEVLAIGRFNETYHYALTRRVPGITFDMLPLRQRQQLLPNLFALLDQLRQTDISCYSGSGLTDATGNGGYPSWSDYLARQHNQKFEFNWRSLANHRFFEMDLYRSLQERMRSLLPFLPATRHLVHGDIGGANMLADGERITGVIDWAEARLGDFLFDVAYLDYWSDDMLYGPLWKQYAGSRGLSVPFFDERMLCYKLHIGMDSMAIAAELDNADDYSNVRQRIWKALSATPA